MNRVHTMAFRLLVASLVFWPCFAARTQAQTPSPSPESAKAPETKPANQEGGANSFAPEPAPQVKHRWDSSTSCCSKSLTRFN